MLTPLMSGAQEKEEEKEEEEEEVVQVTGTARVALERLVSLFRGEGRRRRGGKGNSTKS